MSYSLPYLSVYSSSNQAISVANTAQLVTFDTNELISKVTKTSTSRFTIIESGNYNITLNFSLSLASGTTKVFDIWLKINGTNVEFSKAKIGVANVNDKKEVSHSWACPITAGQYIEVWCSGDDTNLSLTATGTETTPTRPASPSIYLTIQKLP